MLVWTGRVLVFTVRAECGERLHAGFVSRVATRGVGTLRFSNSLPPRQHSPSTTGSDRNHLALFEQSFEDCIAPLDGCCGVGVDENGDDTSLVESVREEAVVEQREVE